MGFLKVTCVRLTFLCLVSVQINSDENICKEGLVGEQRRGEPVLSEEIKTVRHAQPDKTKAEMQFLSINKPMGLKEAGRRFAINRSMNGYHLAVNELREKLDEGTWQCELSSSRPARAQGMGKGRKQQPQKLFKMELDQFTYGITRCGRETQHSEGPCQSHVAKRK